MASDTADSTISDDFTGLLQTIETDLSAAGNWLDNEALAGGEALWSILKVAFLLVTSKQAQVIIDVFNHVMTDQAAGKSLEEIETDMLNTASADELVILNQAGSVIIQGLLAFIQASNTAAAAAIVASKKR